MTQPSDPTYNPYAPPTVDVMPALAGVDGDAEAIRRQFLSHEASIRSVGALYFLNAVVGLISVVFFGLMSIAMIFTDTEPASSAAMMLGLTALFGLVTYLCWYLGQGLRRLDKKVRLGVTIYSSFGLLGFPVGTLISAYILYLLHGEKGKEVMTPEYQAVVAATPHIKYKTPLWIIVLVVGLLGLIGVVLISAFLGAFFQGG